MRYSNYWSIFCLSSLENCSSYSSKLIQSSSSFFFLLNKGELQQLEKGEINSKQSLNQKGGISNRSQEQNDRLTLLEQLNSTIMDGLGPKTVNFRLSTHSGNGNLYAQVEKFKWILEMSYGILKLPTVKERVDEFQCSRFFR